MELREGYKQTEVGVIPDDWSAEHLCSMLKENPKYGINAAAVKLEVGLPTYIRITDISEDGYFSPIEKVGVDNAFSTSYVLEEGDLVFARTGASVGKSYLYNSEDGKLIYAGFLIKVSPDRQLLLPNYLSQFVKTKIYWNWVKVMSMRSGQPGINGNEYGQLLIPLPPTKTEQTAIANALSDADTWIQSLTRLIAKKRQIKQGAMQTLLNPYENGRLKAGWVVKKLKDVGICIRGVSYNGDKDLFAHDAEKTIRLFRSNNVKRYIVDYSNLQFVHRDRVKDRQKMLPDDILICMANGSKKLVGKSARYIIKDNFKYTFGAFMGAFRVLDMETDKKFIFYNFNTSNYRNHIDLLLSGSSINNLKPSDIESIEFYTPRKQEQTRIATILSDMDTDITALETKLTKAQQIKQGMMQNLLTGRIRLI